MKHYHKNPRFITERQYKLLERNLRKYGDLSGITHDLNSNEAITGNQRSKALDFDNCEIVIVEQFDEPDSQGTVARGYVIDESGFKYNYRQVKWTAQECEEANIVANAVGGEWNVDMLIDLFDVDKLPDYGLELPGIKKKKPDIGVEELEDSFHVLIDCVDEREQLKILNRLINEGYQCRALIS